MLHGTHGIFMTQDGQRAADLIQDSVYLRQAGTLFRVAEIFIQHFFDLTQAGLHFACQRRHGLPLLRFPRHVIQPCSRMRQRFARYGRQQTRRHGIGTFGKIIRQMIDLLQRIFHKQQAGCNFQTQAVAGPRVRSMTRDTAEFAQ